jgi:transposase
MVNAGPRLRTAERHQIEYRPMCLDELLPQDHRVRQVWKFVLGLNLSAILKLIKAVEGHPGRPAADPQILVALWLYATVKGIASAREIARLCYEHLAFRWLCGGVGMNAKTLADFRVDHGDAMEQLLIDSFAALMKAGVARLDRAAQDGVRVRAAAGAASFRREKTLLEYRAEAEQRVRELQAEAQKDPGAGARKRLAAQKRGAEDRERRVKEALTGVQELQSKQQAKAEKPKRSYKKEADTDKNSTNKDDKKAAKKKETEPRASMTDPDARVMKMADGGYRPAYNVQFISDTVSGAVAGVSVDNVGADNGKMAPMNDKLAADYGQRPTEHLVDGGYSKFEDIEVLTKAGVTVYAPLKKSRNKKTDVQAPKKKDSPEVAAWRERMETDEAKEIYKERAATAECVNAQARGRGLTQFVVRGVEKVQTCALWHALTHNMMCSWRLVPE